MSKGRAEKITPEVAREILNAVLYVHQGGNPNSVPDSVLQAEWGFCDLDKITLPDGINPADLRAAGLLNDCDEIESGPLHKIIMGRARS